jgi:hypothetical protein
METHWTQQTSVRIDTVIVLARLTRPAARNNYPPRTNQDLRNLHARIIQSSATEEQKLALIYYILRDCRQIPNAESNFARRVYLPKRWQLLMAGLWELDHTQFSRALEHLTDPSLTPTFADEILLTLLSHPKCDATLANAYYISVGPPLSDQKTLDAYFDLLVSSSITEAYYFAAERPRHVHKLLFERLVSAVLKSPPGESRAEKIASLVGLAMSTEEQDWLKEYLDKGSGRKLQGAKEILAIRDSAIGKSTGAEIEA